MVFTYHYDHFQRPKVVQSLETTLFHTIQQPVRPVRQLCVGPTDESGEGTNVFWNVDLWISGCVSMSIQTGTHIYIDA